MDIGGISHWQQSIVQFLFLMLHLYNLGPGVTLNKEQSLDRKHASLWTHCPPVIQSCYGTSTLLVKNSNTAIDATGYPLEPLHGGTQCSMSYYYQPTVRDAPDPIF